MTIVSTYRKSTGDLHSLTGKYSSMTSTRQKKPYTRAPFEMVRVSQSGTLNAKSILYHTLHNGSASGSSTVSENAYAKLMGKALPRASALVNAAQYQSTFSMISKRALQLVRAFNALRRGNLVEFANVLRLSVSEVRRRTTRRKAKLDPEGTWLEFTFGWSPLISDIYNVVDVMQTEFPTVPVRGSAQYSGSLDYTYPAYVQRGTIHTKCMLVANLRITNPNLLLANQLGLLNPAAVVWDIIPFSFVVDWFFPVSRFIKTFNDQAGLSLEVPSTTIVTVGNLNRIQKNGQRGYSAGRRVARSIGVFQKPGLPKTLKLPTGSLWLAATSVALVSKTFGKSS